MHDSASNFVEIPGTQNESIVNFEKFREAFMIISELEHFRSIGYHGNQYGDRETQLIMHKHIKTTTVFDGDSPSVSPDALWNTISMDRATMAVKKIGNFVMDRVSRKTSSDG